MAITYWWTLNGHNAVPAASLEEWSKEFWQIDRRVAQDTIGDAQISTVFLGINHNLTEGPPLLFETKIFGGVHNDRIKQCSTWDEAVKQHAEAVALVRSGLD